MAHIHVLTLLCLFCAQLKVEFWYPLLLPQGPRGDQNTNVDPVLVVWNGFTGVVPVPPLYHVRPWGLEWVSSITSKLDSRRQKYDNWICDFGFWNVGFWNLEMVIIGFWNVKFWWPFQTLLLSWRSVIKLWRAGVLKEPQVLSLPPLTLLTPWLFVSASWNGFCQGCRLKQLHFAWTYWGE